MMDINALYVLSIFGLLNAGQSLICKVQSVTTGVLSQQECTTGFDRCYSGSMTLTATVNSESMKTAQQVFDCTSSAVCDNLCNLLEESMKLSGQNVTVDSCNTKCCATDNCNNKLPPETGVTTAPTGKVISCVVKSPSTGVITRDSCGVGMDRCYSGSMSVSMKVENKSITQTQDIYQCTNNALCGKLCDIMTSTLNTGSRMTVNSCNAECCAEDYCNGKMMKNTTEPPGSSLVCKVRNSSTGVITKETCTAGFDRCYSGKLSITVTVGGRTSSVEQELYQCTNSASCDDLCRFLKYDVETSGQNAKVNSCVAKCCATNNCNINVPPSDGSGTTLAPLPGPGTGPTAESTPGPTSKISAEPERNAASEIANFTFTALSAYFMAFYSNVF